VASKVLQDLAYVPGGVQDIMAEIAAQLGLRVTEGPAELP
jgi:hypothetical protein